jgi:hypothetical protein
VSSPQLSKYGAVLAITTFNTQKLGGQRVTTLFPY